MVSAPLRSPRWDRGATCDACGTDWHERAARWCGRCGAPLHEVDDPEDGRAAAPGWLRWAAAPGLRGVVVRAVAAVAAVGLLAVAVVAARDRVPPRPAALTDPSVETPDDRARDRITRRTDRRTPSVSAPICTADPGCFAWVAEIPTRSSYPTTAVSGDIVITRGTDSLHGFDVRDGTPLWTSPIDQAGRLNLDDNWIVRGGLLLQVNYDGHVIARDVTDGTLRWQADEPKVAYASSATDPGDGTIIVTGQPHDLGELGAPAAVVASFDARSGALLWEVRATAAQTTEDGVVLLTDDATIRALDAAGATRWETDRLELLEDEAWIWVSGSFVTINTENGQEVRHASDGRLLPFPGGHVLAADASGALIATDAAVTELSLFEDDGVVWTTPVDLGQDWCGATLLESVVEIDTCDGGALVLDRQDGSQVERLGPVGDPAPGWWGPRIGPYILQPVNTMTGDGDVVVHDTRDGREVARLPEHSWPVAIDGGHDGTPWTYDLGGIAVARGQNWLVALRLAEDSSGGDDWVFPPRRIGVRTR